jgi:hypothetical protein
MKVYVIMERLLKENDNYEMVIDSANARAVFSSQEKAVEYVREYYRSSKCEDCKLSITETKKGDLYVKVIEHSRIDSIPHEFVISTAFFELDDPGNEDADPADTFYNV